ncbi:MAG: hypothetical protein AB7N91_24205 [Candidatus Tectimicrobiota bacterium]
MQKFVVSLRGSGCCVKVKKRCWVIWTCSLVQSMGFYTTRFVAAASVQEAREKAIAMVEDELRGLLVNSLDQPWSIAVIEILEDPIAFARFAPGSGFTWYLEDPEENNFSS